NDHGSHRIPDPHEFDRDQISAGDAAELPGLVQKILGLFVGAVAVLAGILVNRQRIAGEVDLVPRQQSDHVNEGREHAHGVGAAAEAEQPDPVAVLVGLAQEAVGGEDILIEAGAGRQAEDAVGLLLQSFPGALQADGADAGMIKHPLVLVLDEHTEQFQDVREVGLDLVAGAVAANHYVLRHRPASCSQGPTKFALSYGRNRFYFNLELSGAGIYRSVSPVAASSSASACDAST